MNKIALIILSILLLHSCKTEKKTITKSEINGYYEQQGEGEIVEFNDSLVVFYNSCSFNCFPYWKMPRELFDAESSNVEIIDENTFTNQEGYTILTYKKLNKTPGLCKDLTEEQINNNTYNFETLWNTFNDQYAFFKERNINWDDIKAKYLAKFTDETPTFDFYLLLEKMVLELNDDHSDFVVPDEFDEQWHLLNKKKDTTDYRNLVKNKVLENYVGDIQKYNGGQLAWGKINEEMAYVQLNGMDGLADYQTSSPDEYWKRAEESDDYDQDLIDGAHKIATVIVNEIQDMESCIIDMRFNPGGYDWVGLAFMSHFIDQEHDIFKKKRRFKEGFSDYQILDLQPSKPSYLRPVYILMSPFTVSAAETNIIASLSFPNFTRIGSNTAGALSDQLYKKLPNGWVYHLSNEVYETMDGKVFEVTGVPPDHYVNYPKNEDEFFMALNLELEIKDRAIELAKELEK